jgi:hypothetical protein
VPRSLSGRRAPLALLGLTLAAVALAGAFAGAFAAARAAPRAYNVRSYGARGDGHRNDTPAINRAIAAANRRGGGTVELPPGRYLAGGSVHMLSNVTLRLDAGATLLGAPSGYDPPEPTPWGAYEDPGHSHFHDAMIWGENVSNIAFVGAGTIDGDGQLFTGQLVHGRADKAISLARCRNLTISGITIRRGGHFAILTNGCQHVRSDHLTISTASDRDGWNVISSRDVTITNFTSDAFDDALAFKSDWSLGATLPSGNVTVTNAHLSSICCNALMFGSETCGNFTHYRFSHITITGAGKSGLGMVSMDGAQISDVDYNDVTMSGVAGAIMEKIGTRRSCGGHPGIGSISDIHYTNVSATTTGAYSATLWGRAGHEIGSVSFYGLRLTVPGGQRPLAYGVPSENPDLYNPNTIGPRPAYGFYLHDASGIELRASAFLLERDDGRPALIANGGGGIRLQGVTVQASARSRFDVDLQGVAGYSIVNSRSTRGAGLRVSRTAGTARARHASAGARRGD